MAWTEREREREGLKEGGIEKEKDREGKRFVCARFHDERSVRMFNSY